MYLQSPIVLGSRPAANTGFARIAQTIGEEFGVDGSLRTFGLSLLFTAAAAYLAGWLHTRSTRKAWRPVRDVLDGVGVRELRMNSREPQPGYTDYSGDEESDNYLRSGPSNTTGTEPITATSHLSSMERESRQVNLRRSGPKETPESKELPQTTLDEFAATPSDMD